MHSFRIVVACFFAFALAAAVQARTWTAATGQTLDGDFVKLDGDTVWLQLADGKQAKIKLAQLSQGDQQFVQNEVQKANNPFEVVDGKGNATSSSASPPTNGGNTNGKKTYQAPDGTIYQTEGNVTINQNPAEVQQRTNDAWAGVTGGKSPSNQTPKTTPVSTPPKTGTLAFSPYEIHDPQLNNELAQTLAVPDGWQVKEAAVHWNPNTYYNPAVISFTLTGPTDEVTVLGVSKLGFKWDAGFSRILPPDKMEQLKGQSDNGTILLPPMKPEDFVQMMTQQDKTVSNVQIKKVERPEVIVNQLKKAEAELSKQIQELAGQGMINLRKATFSFDTALVELTCDKDGKRYEQWVCVIIQSGHFPSALSTAVRGAANDEAVYWTVSPILSAFALEGKLKNHEQEIAAILGNSQANPVWNAKVQDITNQTVAAIQKQKLQSQQQIQQQITQTQKSINQNNQDVYKNRMDAQSKVNQGWTDAITGTDRWKDSSGSIHAAPTGYDHGFQNNSTGRMIFSNDPYAAPPPGYSTMNKTPWAW